MAIIQSIPISGSGGSGSTYYTNMTTDEAIAGTNTEERVISAKVLNDAIDNKIPTKVSDLTNDSGFLTSTDILNKADKATTLSGYGITDAYTKTQVDKKVADLVSSAPETLDTLNELANALGNDPNFATTVATQIGTKANASDLRNYLPLAGGAITGNIENRSNSDGWKPGFEWLYNNERYAYIHAFTDEATSNKSLNVQADNFVQLISQNLIFSVSRTYDGNTYNNALNFQCQTDGTSNFYSNNQANLGTSTNKWANVYATTFHGNLVGNADTATKATNNASGNELSNNIIKGLSVSGKVITYTKLDGSTGTITTQDTNTWTAFKGATSSANGTAGYVPAPTKGNQDKFFKADGTWATPTNTTYSVATTSKNGLMSSTDKTKLDGLSNYTLPTASSTLGGVKTTSTVTSTSGLTACPIISGVVYYKDTNTDVKVTNTLNNTTKAYITGTTSAKTNTGTQIFDSGVYLTTTAGQLHADIDFPITEAQVNEILGIA